MGVPMEARVYTLFKILLVAAVSGLVGRCGLSAAAQRASIPARPSANAWIILTAAAVFSALQFIYYNTEFAQYQGRYMFTAADLRWAIWLALG